MHSTRSPAALPAALFVAGLILAPHLADPPIGLAIVGCALGLALRRTGSLAFAAFATGVVLFAIQPGGDLSAVDRSRVVDLVGRVSGSWTDEADGWRGRIQAELVRSGSAIVLIAEPVVVQLERGVVPPPPGARVRLRGHIHRSAGFANARATPPGSWRMRIKSESFLEIVDPPGPVDRVAAELRRALIAPFDRLAGRHAGVAYARALLFGDLRAIAERDQRAFRRAGLAHLMAVSGMNVALAVAFLATAGIFLGRGQRLVLAVLAVVAHLAAVGSAPSLLRASAMAFCALTALALRRPPLPLQALLLSGVALLIVSPRLISDLGFQLSCAATFGLVAVTPRLVGRFGRGPRWLRIGLATSVAAQLATLPLVSAQFASVSPGAVLLNLVYVPLASALLVASFAWAAVGIAVPRLAAVAALPLDLLARPFGWLAHLPAGPWLSLPTAGTVASGLLAFAGVAALLLAPWRPRSLALISVLALATGEAPPNRRAIEVVMADVGQGEGILVLSADGAVLIDGGGLRGRDLAAQVWLPIFAERGIDALDAMVVSHGDADHCGGLIDVAVHLPVREVRGASGFAETPCVRELLFWSRARWRGLAAGDRFAVGGLRFEALWPPPEESATGNGSSLVARLEAEGRSILFTGDLDGEAERRFVGRYRDRILVDTLKVGHHGSARGSGEDLLRSTRPRLALVSAGPANRFGHPAAGVTERLALHGTTLLSTDRLGMITLSWAPGMPIRIGLPGAPRAAD